MHSQEADAIFAEQTLPQDTLSLSQNATGSGGLSSTPTSAKSQPADADGDTETSEVALHREEVNSRKQVDAAKTRKLDAEAKYVESKGLLESQSSIRSLLKQTKELLDMGLTEAEVEKDL